jgi:glycosyltransferase involved in cell wall biosynthesis
MGTPGTYHLVEAYARHAEICVIANATADQNLAVVHTASPTLNLHEIPFEGADYLDEIVEIARDFGPDIVCVTNHSRWYTIVERIKRAFPDARYVLDLKSPYFWDRPKVREMGAKKAPLLDLILTRCEEDIDSWIPGSTRPSKVYPLGLSLPQFSPRKREEDVVRCRRFVFIGTYSQQRELDVLLRYIAALPEPIKAQVGFDLFGTGPAKDELRTLARELGLDGVVKINDALSQDELFALLPTYDAGVAWVPTKIFDAAPSLKMLEYIASGLVPMGTATTAHRRNVEEGYRAVLFDETAEAFARAIESLVCDGIPREDIEKNLELIKPRDWDNVAAQHLLPAFDALLAARAKPVKRDKSADVPKHDDVFGRMLFWSPKIEIPAFKQRPPSSLRVASILGPRLYDGLVDEVQLLLMTPQTWQHMLRFGRPDMLMIESAWFTSTGDWHMAQSAPGAERRELEAIVELAGELGIPTIFWMTVDSQYQDHFAEFAKEFDFVFCADPKSVVAFERQGVKATLLEPAFQPRRYNPIKSPARKQDFGVIYDGWTDLYKRPEIREVLSRIGQGYLSIIETGAMIPRSHVDRVQELPLRNAVMGSVHRSLLAQIYKNSQTYISFSQASVSPTEAAWRLVEAAACRVPLLHLGPMDEGDFRRQFVRLSDDPEDFLQEIVTLRRDRLTRERACHQAWRLAHSMHTFGDRIAKMCAVTGIRHDRPEFPRVTIVTATMRQHLLKKCVEQFRAQTYPNKELVIIFNGSATALDELKSEYGDSGDIIFANVPTDYQAGCMLNFGAKHSTGEYFFRWDDDDYYGRENIADCMLHLRACDADVFGKRASFLHFEGEKEVYLRRSLLPEIVAFPALSLQSNQETWIGGGNFACKLELLRDVRFADDVNFAADTEMVSRIKASRPGAQCLLLDSFNLVLERRDDVGSHTWQSSTASLKKGSELLELRIEDLML